MPLQIPKLDNRSFQDLVDEARRLIPQYSPRWTDHNLSDPGITLLELFAVLVDTMIYRLNRVPEKSYIAFMNLLGIQLQPPSAAQTELVFWLSGELSDPRTEPRLIPAGSEVAIEQTNTTVRPISFTTDADLQIRPPHTVMLLTESAKTNQFERHPECFVEDSQDEVLLFGATPAVGDNFAIGGDHDLSGHLVRLTFEGPVAGVGIDPKKPPLKWQAWCGDDWEQAQPEGEDSTNGLNTAGAIELHLPQAMTRHEIRDTLGQPHNLYWIRCRYEKETPTQPGYTQPPKIHRLSLVTLGARTHATHSTLIVNEILGRSSDLPRQTFRLEYPPVLLPLSDDETVEIQDAEGNWAPWAYRSDFSGSSDKDRHFTLDSVSGEIAFGPSIREPDGRERQYGAIPPAGSLIRFSRYRSGGGAIGNVGPRTLTVLRSALPYVERVSNLKGAGGGRDAEDIERAMLRTPQLLQTRERAVTAEDYVYLAINSGAGIARAHCIQPTPGAAAGAPAPGQVRLLLVPAKELAGEPVNPIDLLLKADDLQITVDHRQQIQAYLHDRRQLTTLVQIEEPKYLEVRVEARLKKRSEANKAAVERAAALRLYRFLNPLSGGADGRGWPFGRSLFISEIFAQLQHISDVEYVESLKLFVNGNAAGNEIRLTADNMIISGTHEVAVV